MKQTIFTLLLLSTIGFVSCRKTGTEPNIHQYDNQQIQNYIKANGITGMQKDLVGGDTSGIYYEPLLKGSGDSLTYSDQISFVFSFRSFDGLYTKTDTIGNQYFGYLGHITSDALPYGLELAILNDLKYVGGSMRVLIPSELAYGVNGYGSGSIKNAGSHIAGNQCLDFYVHVITSQKYNVYGTDNSGFPYTYNTLQNTYDDQVIKNYLATNNLTSYKPDSGIYYNIQTVGTGTDHITDNSTIEVAYNGRLLNGSVFGAANPTDPTTAGVDSASLDVPDIIPGVARMLKKYAVKGTVISMIIPSGQGYGTASTSSVLPPNSCLRFEYTIQTVSP